MTLSLISVKNTYHIFARAISVWQGLTDLIRSWYSFCCSLFKQNHNNKTTHCLCTFPFCLSHYHICRGQVHGPRKERRRKRRKRIIIIIIKIIIRNGAKTRSLPSLLGRLNYWFRLKQKSILCCHQNMLAICSTLFNNRSVIQCIVKVSLVGGWKIS